VPPYDLFPTGPIQVCKNADGRFTVNLDSSNFIGAHYIAPYHTDDISPVVSSREGAGVY
jgi:hypothetical protein